MHSRGSRITLAGLRRKITGLSCNNDEAFVERLHE